MLEDVAEFVSVARIHGDAGVVRLVHDFAGGGLVGGVVDGLRAFGDLGAGERLVGEKGVQPEAGEEFGIALVAVHDPEAAAARIAQAHGETG